VPGGGRRCVGRCHARHRAPFSPPEIRCERSRGQDGLAVVGATVPLPGGRTPVIEDSFASEFLWLVLGQLVGEKGTIPAPLLTLPSHIAVQIIAEQVRHPAHGRRFHSTPPVLCSSGASTSCRGQSSAVSSGLARWGQHSIQDVCPPRSGVLPLAAGRPTGRVRAPARNLFRVSPGHGHGPPGRDRTHEARLPCSSGAGPARQ